MKYWTIVRAALTRKKVRTFMTIASIATAFLLFSLGRSVAVAFTSEVDYAGKDRLVVSSKLSFTQAMPMSYANRIEALEGVEKVAWRQWFGGTYIDRANFFPKWPVPESYFDIFPEFIVSEGGKEAFSRNIQGMIAGADLAEKYGWEIGDRIPIIGDIWVKSDNSNNWEFDLVGMYTNANGGAQDEAYINWKYFDESRAYEKGLVGQFSVKIRDPNQAEVIAKDVDTLFANSPDETKTSTEEAFSRMFAEQVGDIGFIINSVLAASFFTILLLTANTMSQAVRERTNELGVLKSIGYPDALIMIFVLMESVLICLIGAAIGVLMAFALFPFFSGVALGFAGQIEFSFSIVLSAIALALLTATISGLLPAYSAMRLNVVDALRKN